jgi:ATP-dependent RNA helicase DDX3X
VPSINSFKELKLRDLVMENIKRCNYETPTPIQRHASPQLAAGKDLMACAQTGSGKTVRLKKYNFDTQIAS